MKTVWSDGRWAATQRMVEELSRAGIRTDTDTKARSGNYTIKVSDLQATKARQIIRQSNPGAFAKCVASVKKRGGAADPRAVCAAAGRAKYGQAEMTRRSLAGKKKAARRKNIVPPVPLPSALAQVGDYVKVTKFLRSGKFNKGKRKNPADGAAKGYEDFHGRPSKEDVVLESTVHYHRHLAAAGKLEKLAVVSRQGYKVTLSGFKGAILAFNEKRTQLFIEGGDQSVSLREFGISTPHEMETLGEVLAVEYFTTKDHLGSDGGTAIYRHKFHRPYPELVYDAVNQKLMFSGGKYVILPEGIDK